jgi:hypothetical protein
VPDFHSLFKGFAEELDRLDPRDFDPAARHDFVILRVAIRNWAKGQIGNGAKAAADANTMSGLLDAYQGEGARTVLRQFPFANALGDTTISKQIGPSGVVGRTPAGFAPNSRPFGAVRRVRSRAAGCRSVRLPRRLGRESPRAGLHAGPISANGAVYRSGLAMACLLGDRVDAAC